MKLSKAELKEFLDEKYERFNRPGFIESDPVGIPHLFDQKEDIEIIGFLAATIAWGQRPTIIKNARKLAEWMDMAPHDFVLNATPADIDRFADFKHRTFNGEDAMYFMTALQHLYQNKNGIEGAFAAAHHASSTNTMDAICGFRNEFFALAHPARTQKHVSNPAKGSSAKRLNMYLRWMVRDDGRGVDFGLWKAIRKDQLVLPLDVHTGNVGRQLGLLKRKQNDWKAAIELNDSLKKLDPDDPVKYDYALFGLGVFEGFGS